MSFIAIFCGPTISHEEIGNTLDARLLGPAGRGDVLRCMKDGPTAIAVIDGYFRERPAVWQKELLFALSRGVHVFGAASMGALRAAELSLFGMKGVGKVFELFRSGELTDDDEVAVVHASEEHGYRKFSDAMVNIRSTLANACEQGIVSPRSATQLVDELKQLPYVERSFERLILVARKTIPFSECETLGDWLPQNMVDQKLQDARQLVRILGDHHTKGWDPVVPQFHFAPTDAWNRLQDLVSEEICVAGETTVAEIIEEAIIAGLGPQLRESVLARSLAVEGISNVKPDRDATDLTTYEFRAGRGLLGEQKYEQWCREQELELSDSPTFFQHEASLRRARLVHGSLPARYVLDHLRSMSRLGALKERAREKSAALEEDSSKSTFEVAGQEFERIWKWFVENVRINAGTDSLDTCAVLMGISPQVLRRTAIREFRFRQAREGTFRSRVAGAWKDAWQY